MRKPAFFDSTRSRALRKRATRRTAERNNRPRIEELENRVVLSVGGGWINSTQFGQSGQGMLGQYYNNSSLSGTPSFTRWDSRVDLTYTQDNAYVSGSPDPNLGSVGPNNWSAQWTGILQPSFSETYTFVVNSAGNGMRLWVNPVAQQQGSPIINEWTSHGQSTETVKVTLQAGQDYAVELQLSETTATVQQIQLQWSSPSTPLEDIEPAVATGLNILGGDNLYANMVNGASSYDWYAPDSWTTIVPEDSNFWPEGDAKIALGANDNSTLLGGTYLVQFTGMATVNEWPQNADWIVNGTDLHSDNLLAGDGYNPATNTTTALMVVPPGTSQAYYLIFNNTARDPDLLGIGGISGAGTTVTVSLPSVAGFQVNQHVLISGLTGTAASLNGVFTITGVNAANNTITYTDTASKITSIQSATPASTSGATAADLPANGITNLYVMQPTTPGGNTPVPVGTLFTPSALEMIADYSVLRFMDLSYTNGNNITNWSQRDIPSYNMWSSLNGTPWEVLVALANETGKDMYINVPSNASTQYISDLANLIAYGSNGVTPYTSVQQDPLWKPLNPNLKVYIEFSNEVWNSGFSQSESRDDGWANQLSQRALYDYLTANQNDPLYPGGGNNAYSDGALLASYYDVNSSNDSAFLATYNPDPAAATDGGSPLYFNNSASINGYTVGQGWVGLRNVQISNAFKTAFGETTIDATATGSRVRPVFEWQSGGGWIGALGFISTIFGSQNPVSYYLYGGGGTWYDTNSAGGFTNVSFVNPSFADGFADWSTTGTAGVVTNGSSLGNPESPPLFSAIAMTDGATESGNTVTITTTTPHSFLVGQSVVISGVTVSGYNGTFTITSVTSTTFTYQDSTKGLASSGDGIVTGKTGSLQTAYLEPGASISQNVTFTGGYADLTLYAAQTAAADGSGGLSITLTPTNGGPAINNGLPITESEGAGGWSNVNGQFAWDRSEAFYTGSASYSYTIKITCTVPAGTVFVDNLAIQTVNGMFNETNTAIQNGALSISSSIEADINIAKQYGLNDVGYEGGYYFDQNLSGYLDVNGYRDMGSRGYSSSIPNVGTYANLDPRTEQLAASALDQFYAAGGTLAIEYESAGNINSWAVAAPTYYNWNTSKLAAVAYVEQHPQAPTYGVTVGQSAGSTSWWLNPAGGDIDNTFLLATDSYVLTLDFAPGWGDTPSTQVDPVKVLVDGNVIDTVNVSPLLGGNFPIPLGTLSAGQHGIEIINVAPATNFPIGLGGPGVSDMKVTLANPPVTTGGGSSQTPEQVSLASSYNRQGIEADGSKFSGGLDGLGSALSANLLGTSQTWAGNTFTIGPAGANDVVTASGQTISLPTGQYSTLELLATSVNGASTSQTFTVTYSDGTTQSFTQSISDWSIPQSFAGESKAITMTYRDESNGTKQTQNVYVYGYSFALNDSKTVVSITLPSNSHVDLLAATLVPTLVPDPPPTATTEVNLSGSYNRQGIEADGSKFSGGLDGFGAALSANLLGTSQTWAGNTFTIGPAGANDVVTASGQTISLPTGQYSTLELLATSVNGASTSQTFTVTYSDGTTQSFTQSISDWSIPQSFAGESKAITMTYRDESNGTKQTQNVYVYGYSFALNDSKTVVSITLPSNSHVDLLAATLVPTLVPDPPPTATTEVNLSGSYNRQGIEADGSKFSGGLDGFGAALSANLLGTSQTWAGNTFTIGPAGANDVVTASGQTISLPTGQYSTLELLATSVNGASTSQTFTVTYSDGTTQSFTQSISDWSIPQSFAGESKAITMTYRDESNGTKQTQNVYVYGYSFALNDSKTVVSITLPGRSNVKILAMDLTS